MPSNISNWVSWVWLGAGAGRVLHVWPPGAPHYMLPCGAARKQGVEMREGGRMPDGVRYRTPAMPHTIPRPRHPPESATAHTSSKMHCTATCKDGE